MAFDSVGTSLLLCFEFWEKSLKLLRNHKTKILLSLDADFRVCSQTELKEHEVVNLYEGH